MSTPTDPALLAALAKLAPFDRGSLSIGTYAVDAVVTLHVQATVDVREDYSQRVTQAARPWAIVAHLVRELTAAYIAAGREGVDLAALVAAAEAAGEDKAIQSEISGIVASFKAPTWRECRGAVTVTGACEVLASGELPAKVEVAA